MKVTQEQLETLTALIDELKAVRRVRTPAGVERYDQPIGSVIVPKPPTLPNMPKPLSGSARRIRSSERKWSKVESGDELMDYFLARSEGVRSGLYERWQEEGGEDWRAQYLKSEYGGNLDFMLENNDHYISGNVYLRVAKPKSEEGRESIEKALPRVFELINELRDKQPIEGHISISFSDGVMRNLSSRIDPVNALGMAVTAQRGDRYDAASKLSESILIARFSDDRRDTIAFQLGVLTNLDGSLKDVEDGWWTVDNMNDEEALRYLMAHEWGHLVPPVPDEYNPDKEYLSDYSRRNNHEETAEAFAAWFMDSSIGNDPSKYEEGSREWMIADYAKRAGFGKEYKFNKLNSLVIEDMMTGAEQNDVIARYPEIMFDILMTGVDHTGGEEKTDRRVRDPEYWGVPYGTPIVPGMKPRDGQMPLPGMPKLPVEKFTESDRINNRPAEDIEEARRNSRYLREVLESWSDEYDTQEVERVLYNNFGVELEFTYGEENPFVVGGDWLKFGGARDIREAGYDLLGFDPYDRYADPHIHGGDPGWGGAAWGAKDPLTLAYSILEDIKSANRTDIPLYRGVTLGKHGISPKEFIADLERDGTFDLPIASFAGNIGAASRFGTDVIFKLQKGSRAILGGYMGRDDGEPDDLYFDDGDPLFAEWVSGGRFKVTNIKKIDYGQYIVSIRQISVFDPGTGLSTKMPNRRWKYAYLFDNSLRVQKQSPTTNAAEVLLRTKTILEGLLEEKGRRPSVRHVRTPEGSRRYGLPIGAVIVADTELTNFRELPSDWDGYDKYRGANGFNYWVYEENRRWYAVDDDNYEIFNAASESELLQMIDDDARDPRAKEYRGIRTAPEGFHSASMEERNALKVPPAWVDVFVNDDQNNRLLAVGYDGKDRKQSLYSAEHSQEQAEKKYKRMKTLHKYIPSLDRNLKEDWKTNEDARVTLLLRRMGMRIGSTSDTRAEKQAYGAATLEARHVRINKDSVTFTFTGKKGVQLSLNSKDPDVLAMMKIQMQGKSRRDLVFPDATPTSVAAYLRDKTHPDVMVKDLRTYKANEIALAAISRIKRKPKTEAEFKRMRNAVGDDVAAVLGNTRAMALGSYINPTVFEAISEDPAWLEKIVGKKNLPSTPDVPDTPNGKDSKTKLKKVQAGLYYTEDDRFQIESTDRMDSPGPTNWILSELNNGQYEYWNHFASLADARAAIERSVEFESAPRVRYRLPFLFWEDHYGRFAIEFDLPDLDRMQSGNYVNVELTKEQYENLLGDAEYYVEMAEELDPEFRRRIVPSARAIIRALQKEGAPE